MAPVTSMVQPMEVVLMLLSPVMPLPGHSLKQAIEQLDRYLTELGNRESGSASELLRLYLEWVNQAATNLGYEFASDDVSNLILSPRYWALVGMATTYSDSVVHGLLTAERAERKRALTSLKADLTKLQSGCSSLPSHLLVADSNVYLHAERPWDDLDWQALVGTSETVRLLIPPTVVRELDTGKRGGRQARVSDTNPELVRTRARVSSRRLRLTFADHPEQAATVRPGFEAELILNPLRHRAMDDPDSELIDRALAVKDASGKDVAIVTGDGNMQFNARTAGLGVVPLYEPEVTAS